LSKVFTIRNFFLFIVFFTWSIYAVFYGFFTERTETKIIAGYLSLFGEFGLDFIAAILAFYLWRRFKQYKLFFFMFGVSFLMATFSDFFYNFIVNISQIERVSVWVDSVWDIPFLGFLFLQALVWCLLFFNDFEIKETGLLIYIPYTLVGLIIFFSFMFALSWQINYFSILGLYQIMDTVLEVFGFIFASFCLIRSSNACIKYLSTGYLLIISSDLIIRSSVVTLTLKPGNLLEATWVFGLLLVIMGFSFLLQHSKKKIKYLMK
jgi:hypothetical protein